MKFEWSAWSGVAITPCARDTIAMGAGADHDLASGDDGRSIARSAYVDLSQWHGKAFECRVSCAALCTTSMCEKPTTPMTKTPSRIAIAACNRAVFLVAAR